MTFGIYMVFKILQLQDDKIKLHSLSIMNLDLWISILPLTELYLNSYHFL